eukprot:SM000037S13579  [mRNA]  locus=s37:714483:717979:+ [translate_table: standard]
MLVRAASADGAGACVLQARRPTTCRRSTLRASVALAAGSGAPKKLAPAVGSAPLADHVVLEGEAAAAPATEQERVAKCALPGPPTGRPPGTTKAAAKEERRQRREEKRVEKRVKREQRRAEKQARRGDGDGRRGGGRAAASPSGSSNDDMGDQPRRMPSQRGAADNGIGDDRTYVASRDSMAAAMPSSTKWGRHDTSSDEDVRNKGDVTRRPCAGGAGSMAAERAGAPLRRPRHDTEIDDNNSSDGGLVRKGRHPSATGRGGDARSDRSHGQRSPERDRMYDRRRADRSRERRLATKRPTRSRLSEPTSIMAAMARPVQARKAVAHVISDDGEEDVGLQDEEYEREGRSRRGMPFSCGYLMSAPPSHVERPKQQSPPQRVRYPAPAAGSWTCDPGAQVRIELGQRAHAAFCQMQGVGATEQACGSACTPVFAARLACSNNHDRELPDNHHGLPHHSPVVPLPEKVERGCISSARGHCALARCTGYP